jgi:hypothetical protein
VFTKLLGWIVLRTRSEKVNDRERLRHDRPQERRFDLRTSSAAEQVSDLRDHRRRDEDRAPGEVQPVSRSVPARLCWVVAISGRNQRTGVANYHQERPSPSESRSSWLHPRSDRPLANESNHGGGHSPADTDPL